MLLSESAALFAVTLTIWAGYRYWQAPSTRAGVALAAAAALAAMCRAELVLLGLFVVVPLLVRHGERGTRAIARRVGAGAVAAMVVIGPWVGYNLTRFEHPVYLSVGAEITLASATCEQTYYGEGTGYWSYFCARDVRDQIRREFPPRLETIDGVEREVPQLDQSEEAPYFRTYATDYIRDHIGRFPVVVAARWGRVLYLWNPAHVVRADTFPEGRDPGIAQWGRWTFYPLALLAIGGAVTLRRRRVPVYPVAAVFLTVGAAVTLAFGTPRYRASAETALCLLAAVGITALAETLAARRARTPDSPADAPVA
jgi:4-amino-4-deoxy-L-arabinose transferase-like glycosyltransferase